MEIYKKLTRKVEKLVEKLQEDITSGHKRICENYGQKEIHKFMDKELKPGLLHYTEECNIKDILYRVSSIH